jgi:hypothetical protein
MSVWDTQRRKLVLVVWSPLFLYTPYWIESCVANMRTAGSILWKCNFATPAQIFIIVMTLIDNVDNEKTRSFFGSPNYIPRCKLLVGHYKYVHWDDARDCRNHKINWRSCSLSKTFIQNIFRRCFYPCLKDSLKEQIALHYTHSLL